MKKKYIILFSSILLLVILAVFITLEIINMNNKDDFQKSSVNIYTINKEKEKNEKDKVEEQKKLWENEEELYITINNNVINCCKNKQNWIFEDNTSIDYMKSYFNKLWNELQIQTLHFTQNEYALITLQLSRYGYPYDDLDFTILETLTYKENGTYEVMYSDPFYYKNENKNKMISINTANKGKSILGYKILIKGENNTFEKYYLYKIDVQ